ncbi:MAG: fatty acyl-AMP ligase [Deltaproteobacteria bacterium]|nr:fatty acyl-AMP ligase [Deltaproteobacteria bacterium]
MIETLLDGLKNAESVDSRGYRFIASSGDGSKLYSFAELAKEVARRGSHLQRMGLVKGDRIGMIIPDPEEFVLSFLGAVRVGVVPVPMYPPLALGKLDGFMAAASRILIASEARMLLTTKDVSTILWGLTTSVKTLEDIVLVDKLHGEVPPPAPVDVRPEDVCFVQFTSGSTSDPKGVLVSHRNLVANATAIMHQGLGSDPTKDTGVSWLPLYHDMGLIGFVIAPLMNLTPIVFIPTLRFVKHPRIWMETIAKYRGTLTFAPNFAFALAAKFAEKQVSEGIDLSCLKVVGCGAEPINADTLRRFIDGFVPAGLRPESVMPCYGMAEATLAMSFDRYDAPFSVFRADREIYEYEHKAVPVVNGRPALELVGCGWPFAGHELAIRSEKGALVDEGVVGEIVFRGPSVTPGYFKNPEATSRSFEASASGRGGSSGGWLRTGDLGFVKDGQVFVTGRAKDLIILNGRNYAPQAIEWEVEQVDGVRKGNVVAFARRGRDTEELVVVAETRESDKDVLAKRVSLHVKSSLGLVVSDVVLLPAGSLPKTSSGKLQRKRTKDDYEAKTLGTENRTMGGTATKAKLAQHMTRSMVAQVRHKVRRFSEPMRNKSMLEIGAAAARRFGRSHRESR